MEQIKYINDIRIDYSGVLCMFAPMTMTCAGILVQLRSNPGRIYRYSVVQIAVTLVRREGSRRGLKSITPPLVSWYTLMNHGIWCVVCWWSLAVVHSCWSGVSKPKLSKEKRKPKLLWLALFSYHRGHGDRWWGEMARSVCIMVATGGIMTVGLSWKYWVRLVWTCWLYESTLCLWPIFSFSFV